VLPRYRPGRAKIDNWLRKRSRAGPTGQEDRKTLGSLGPVTRHTSTDLSPASGLSLPCTSREAGCTLNPQELPVPAQQHGPPMISHAPPHTLPCSLLRSLATIRPAYSSSRNEGVRHHFLPHTPRTRVPQDLMTNVERHLSGNQKHTLALPRAITYANNIGNHTKENHPTNRMALKSDLG
jgi:hypothetical protein